MKYKKKYQSFSYNLKSLISQTLQGPREFRQNPKKASTRHHNNMAVRAASQKWKPNPDVPLACSQFMRRWHLSCTFPQDSPAQEQIQCPLLSPSVSAVRTNTHPTFHSNQPGFKSKLWEYFHVIVGMC